MRLHSCDLSSGEARGAMQLAFVLLAPGLVVPQFASPHARRCVPPRLSDDSNWFSEITKAFEPPPPAPPPPPPPPPLVLKRGAVAAAARILPTRPSLQERVQAAEAAAVEPMPGAVLEGADLAAFTAAAEAKQEQADLDAQIKALRARQAELESVVAAAETQPLPLPLPPPPPPPSAPLPVAATPPARPRSFLPRHCVPQRSRRRPRVLLRAQPLVAYAPSSAPLRATCARARPPRPRTDSLLKKS